MRSSQLRTQWVWIIAAVVLLATAVKAQDSGVRPRIAEAVNNGNRVIARGNVHPFARPQFDRGLAPDSLPMEHMLLVLQRSQEQEASLAALLDAQQDPASPQFHKWVTPQQFGQLFGPADSDIAAVTGWLNSQGFQVNSVSPGRTVIDFSGTASQVRGAFRTDIHRYAVDGVERWANSSDPQIPVVLAPVVVGVASLHNFPLRPLHRVASALANSGVIGSNASTEPEVTLACGTSCNFLGPYDLATIYNILPLWNAGTDGTGEIIALPERSNINIQDVRAFRKLFGLPANDPNIIVNNLDPGLLGGLEEGEADLDVQWAGAVAKNAAIDMVVSSSGATDGVQLSAQFIVNVNFAPVMSVSFGVCELGLGTAGNQQVNQMWQQAAAQGITVMVATGDEGSAGCEGPGTSAATTGLAVNGVSSTPYNIAVGGTSFDDIGNASAYWNSTNNPTTQASAKGYIPEIVWNDSCSNGQLSFIGFGTDPESNCNDPVANSDGFLSVTGAGGGMSNCTSPSGATPATCAGGNAKPSWQAGSGVPKDGKRDVPDVSLFAGSQLAANYYVVCQTDSNTNNQPCSLSRPGATFAPLFGTSASAPVFAGMMALVDQKTGGRQGNAGPMLYKLAAGSGASCASSATAASSCIFYDITAGTNAMPCTAGSPNCVVSHTADAYGILSGYNATANYDLATGLGSVNAANLANNWPASTVTVGPPALQVIPSSLTINIPAAGQSASSTVTVSAMGGFSGTVSLACNVAPTSVNDVPTCSFSPASVALNTATTSATVTLKIASTAPQKASSVSGWNIGEPHHPRGLIFAVITGVPLLGLFAFWRRQHPLYFALATILLLGSVAGCGGGSASSNSSATGLADPGTTSGNYAVTITASSGNIKQTTNVFVSVP